MIPGARRSHIVGIIGIDVGASPCDGSLFCRDGLLGWGCSLRMHWDFLVELLSLITSSASAIYSQRTWKGFLWALVLVVAFALFWRLLLNAGGRSSCSVPRRAVTTLKQRRRLLNHDFLRGQVRLLILREIYLISSTTATCIERSLTFRFWDISCPANCPLNRCRLLSRIGPSSRGCLSRPNSFHCGIWSCSMITFSRRYCCRRGYILMFSCWGVRR